MLASQLHRYKAIIKKKSDYSGKLCDAFENVEMSLKQKWGSQ